jgi:hypothetical protein
MMPKGEQIEILWDAEIGASILAVDTWANVGRGAPDSPEILAAHLRAVRWRSATAADRDLLQAPFRAGIRLDPYQLLPLRKALRLPRVNLLIADDVGLGKTIEAGLVARELLLRRRVDLIVISAPRCRVSIRTHAGRSRDGNRATAWWGWGRSRSRRPTGTPRSPVCRCSAPLVEDIVA